MLTLHLKRFQQDLSGRLRKIDGPVPFPRKLDLSPFCDPEVKLAPMNRDMQVACAAGVMLPETPSLQGRSRVHTLSCLLPEHFCWHSADTDTSNVQALDNCRPLGVASKICKC